MLNSFVKGGVSSAPIRQMVRWLMLARDKGRWGNTQENAYAMEALVNYYRAYEAETPNFTASVKLGETELTRAQFQGRSTNAQKQQLPMAQLMAAAPAGSNQPLTFTREGTGTLFYTARLRYAIDQFFSQGLDAGFRVERRYELFEGTDGSTPTSFTAGDLVRVTLTFQLPKERRFVAVTDPLPAGFEAVESWFETTKSSLAQQTLQSGERSQDQLAAQLGRRLFRSRRTSRRSHAAVRHQPQRRLAHVQLRRSRHHVGHVPHRADAGGGDVFAGDFRAHREHADRGAAVRRAVLGARAAQAASEIVRVAGVRRGDAAVAPSGAIARRPARRTTAVDVVVDRHGVQLYEARSGDGTRTVTLTAAALPPTLVAATIAAEDRRFWSHPGVDPIAILRAAKTNLAERSLVEGGSTITQQVAKLLLNRKTPARTRGWSAKVDEAVIALRLEHRFTKRELLAMYLNLAGYGNQVSGVERASQVYFGVAILDADARAGGLPRRAAATALRVQSVSQSRRRDGASAGGAEADAGGGCAERARCSRSRGRNT